MADAPPAPETPVPSTPLSIREQRFVDELLLGATQAEAARRAGYSPRSARETGRRLAAAPHVAAEIARRRAELAERATEDRERILAELRHLAFLDIGDVFEFHGRALRLRPGRDIPPEARRALAAIKVKRHTPRGVEPFEILEVKLADKEKALELLGRHYGMFAETHRHVGHTGGAIETVTVTLTEAERATRVAELLAAARARRDGV